MRVVFIRILAALVMAGAGQAMAFETGNDLHMALSNTNNRVGAMLFIKGVVRGMDWGFQIARQSGGGQTKLSESVRPMNACPPDGVTVGQLSDVVSKYLVDNPEKRHMDASLLILAAVKNAFPC